jgi:hypothetical protein
MDLAAFIAPYPLERFMGEIYDRSPLHIPAEGEGGERRRLLLPWSRMNALLGIAAQWSEANVKLILNGQAVLPDLYVDPVTTRAGIERRADPAKIHLLLAMGASLVADAIEDAEPGLRRVTAMLSGYFLGVAGANAYCSFRNVQAFRSHCDLHDVFAVHCEGEKIWRIYENRAPDPVELYQGNDVHAVIDRAKGRLMAEVTMRPGDLLYIPRGYYHDALAASEASLHVSFSVARHTGRVIFRVLEELAMGDAAFRAYLPDGRTGDGRALGERLDSLAPKIGALMRTPLFRNALLNRQLELAKPAPEVTLPERPSLRIFARTQRQWQIVSHEAGAMLVWQLGRAPLGLLEEQARWFLSQDAASVEQLVARFPHHGEPALVELVRLLQRAGLVEPFSASRARGG